MQKQEAKKRYSVSEITELIKGALEERFNFVCVEGEISNYKPYPSGHIYFTLKDSGAVISAVMFKSSVRSLMFKPKDGANVLIYGRIQVYPPRGGYQLIADRMEELSGTGALLEMLEKRKRLFAAEGLFDEERKKAIPRFPETVGVVTSAKGAAIRDILQVLGRRAASLRVIILPSPVQGEEAAEIIARRIRQANQWRLADVLIVGRGGGAMEDLLPFSEEVVVRAVAESEIPVISAVGHEIDWALCDYAADLRAPTPSAAAELVCENSGETLSAVRYFSNILKQTIKSRLERTRLLLQPFSLDNLERQIRQILQPRLIRFDDAKESLVDAASGRIESLKRRLELIKTFLEGANPAAVLERGFSVVVNTRTGGVVKSAACAQKGDILSIRTGGGTLEAETLRANFKSV